jgi:hypothetical protein
VPGSRPRKILVSARDAGAAKSILPILKHGFASPAFSCEVVAQGPAVGIFAGAGVSFREFRSGTTGSRTSSEADRIREEARALLRDIQPDAIVTGQSAPDMGVDEAVIAESSTPWTFTVQDVDGLVIPGFGALAPFFFVSKPAAAALTKQRADVETIVVGSLRHANYSELNPLTLREEGRRLIPTVGRAIGFYGQPAWHLPGYQRTLERFADALRELAMPFTLVYRPHPKETASDRQRTHSILSDRGVPVLPDPAPSVEMSLCAVDLVVVCYSSCGIDQVHLQRRSGRPLNVSLFLMFDENIRANYVFECGVEAPSEIGQGLARGLTADLTSPRQLTEAISDALRPSARDTAWQTVQQVVEPASDAPAKVIAHIEHINWSSS